MPEVPPPNLRGMGGGIHAAFLLGTGLLPAATRQGQGPPGRRTRAGVQVDPHALSVLAGSYPVQGVRLSPGTQQPWVIPAPQSCEGGLKNRKKTLTAPLRACVRLGMTLRRRVTCRHSHRLPQDLGLFLRQCLGARGVLRPSRPWFQNSRSLSIRDSRSYPSPGPLVVRFLLVARPYTAGAPAKHHAAIMGSQMAHPKEEVGTKGTMGCPYRWCIASHPV